MRKIVHNEISKLFEGTSTRIHLNKVESNEGKGVFINVTSDGLRYAHTGSGYFSKSELLGIEVSCVHSNEAEDLLAEVSEVIVKLLLTNEAVLECIEDVPQVDVSEFDLDDFGEFNKASMTINIILSKTEELQPEITHELDSINTKITHHDKVVFEELKVTSVAT